MIYIYYRVSSASEFKAKMTSYFETARELGLVSLMQKKGEPELFMEVISETSDADCLMKRLSDLREKSGINKLIRENKIHKEIFDKILEV